MSSIVSLPMNLSIRDYTVCGILHQHHEECSVSYRIFLSSFRSDALPTEPIVLPTDSAFYLFQYKRDKCQKVANMQVAEEWVRWDDEDFVTPSKSEIGAVHPGMEFWNQLNAASGSEIYYCYYSPQK